MNLNKLDPPHSPDLPVASISQWCHTGDGFCGSVLRKYLEQPGTFYRIYREQRERELRTGVPVWEPIQEIMDWEFTHTKSGDCTSTYNRSLTL